MRAVQADRSVYLEGASAHRSVATAAMVHEISSASSGLACDDKIVTTIWFVGPWYNAKGVRITTNVAELHSDKNAINKDTRLDEKGAPIKGRGDAPNQHDMLTGT